MPSSDPVEYRIRPGNPEAHLFEVELRIPDPDPDGQVLVMPAWIPGSYMIRDFARNIVSLRARCPAGPLDIEKLDKQTWRCAPCEGPLSVRCEVYAWDLSVRSAHLDTTHGYFNGTSVFLRAPGREDEPCLVRIDPPAGEAYQRWRVLTTLPPAEATARGFGLYRARDYEALVDHPVEMGEPTVVEFEAGGVPHRLAITGRHRADLARIGSDLSAICSHHAALFGGPPPVERYLFLLTVVGDGYGGLEHRDSSSLICRREDLPREGEGEPGEGYRRLLGLCSHEYFHLWNVKRIRPERFIPYDLSREVHTRLLWAFEGITSYYDELALVRSGCIRPEGYLALLAATVSRVLRGSGRLRQSVAESSFDAWTRFYKQDENAPNAIVSYYAKGALVALALDLTIRLGTDGSRCLDDLMRALWREHGEPGTGVPEDGVERLAARVSGLDLSDFFRRFVHGTEDPPLADLLADFGVAMRLRPARNARDNGTAEPPAEDEAPAVPALGARFKAVGDWAEITVVPDAGPAQRAGLAPGDRVVAVDGVRAGPDNLEALIARLPEGATTPVHVFRRDELMSFELRAEIPPPDTCDLWLVEDPGEARAARRAAWLQREA
jgi:predicted metalloprotease with PDZ domain